MKDVLRIVFREIKHSFGRFIAIFSIIALGVGFFSGLRITEKAMLNTGDDYAAKYNMFDYRIISTYGFSKDEIKEISHMEEISAIKGAYTLDAEYLSNGGNSLVVSVHSITSSVNDLCLTAGRLPTGKNECVADYRQYDSSNIGETIKLSVEDGNAAGGLTENEFTIVGIASTPLYLNYNRGNSTIGNGSVSFYIFVTEDAFESEYYTECYLKINGKYRLYSNEYNDAVESVRKALEIKCESTGIDRYNTLYSTTEQALAAAESSIADSETKLQFTKTAVDTIDKLNGLGLLEGESAADNIKSAVDSAFAMGLLNQEQYAYMNSLIDGWNGTKENASDQIKAWLKNSKDSIESGEKEIADAKEELEKGKEAFEDFKEPQYYLLTRNENTGYICFRNDTQIVSGISTVFPIFFFLVAALVCNTTMSRMVREQRGQIGILKALGYSDIKIKSIYLIYSGVAALSGWLLGYFFGSWIFPKIIWHVYDLLYGFADIEYAISLTLAILSLAVSLICSVGVAYITVTRVGNENPASLMRPANISMGRFSHIEKIPFIGKMSFSKRISLRNTFRYKSRFIMMLLGIGGCVALLITAFGLRDSINDVSGEQFGNIMSYDYSISLKTPIDNYGIEELRHEIPEGITGTIGVYETEINVSYGDTTQSVKLNAFEKSDISSFITLKKGSERVRFPGKGEAVISADVADRFNLDVGDIISGKDSKMQEYTFTISGIFDNHVYSFIFVSRASMELYMEDGITYNKIFADKAEGADNHTVSNELTSLDNVLSVQINDDIVSMLDDMLGAVDLIVVILTLSAGALAFIVIYNLTNLNIIERVREIATLKVLGMRRFETASYVFRETIMQTVLGIILGIPLGILLNAFVISKIKMQMVFFTPDIEPVSFIYSVLIALVFAMVINIALLYKMGEISMTESLKSVE